MRRVRTETSVTLSSEHMGDSTRPSDSGPVIDKRLGQDRARNGVVADYVAPARAAPTQLSETRPAEAPGVTPASRRKDVRARAATRTLTVQAADGPYACSVGDPEAPV